MSVSQSDVPVGTLIAAMVVATGAIGILQYFGTLYVSYYGGTVISSGILSLLVGTAMAYYVHAHRGSGYLPISAAGLSGIAVIAGIQSIWHQQLQAVATAAESSSLPVGATAAPTGPSPIIVFAIQAVTFTAPFLYYRRTGGDITSREIAPYIIPVILYAVISGIGGFLLT